MMLVPPSTVLEVSTDISPTLAPVAKEQARPAGEANMNLCRAHHNGYGHCLSQPRVSGHADQHDDGGACQLLARKPLR
jgi:hypothetical protein